MTTTALDNFIPKAAIGRVVIDPRGRRMFWNVAGKYTKTGKQKGPS